MPGTNCFLLSVDRASVLTLDINTAILSVCPSACMYVRLSVTFRYSVETASPCGSPIILVL